MNILKGMKNMKRALAILLSVCLCITLLPVGAGAQVRDESQVKNLLSMLNIMVGDSDGNFYPDNAVTRAEFTKVAIMASSYSTAVPENSTTAPFGDVPYTFWAAPYITLGVDNNLLTGYPDSTFRPENPVLLEEAVTVCLKLLGYTEQDYGKVWPSGPISLARSKDLLENVDKSSGENLTRRDVMYLIYNTLHAKVKGTQNELINSLNYSYLEDVTLIATQKEDPSVSKNKIVTSSGTYKLGENFDTSVVGQSGDAFLKDGDTLVSFIPRKQTFESHAVYSVLNGDIIVYENGSTAALDVEDDLTLYSGSKTSTVSDYLTRFKTGDTLKIAYDEDGDVDYIIHSGDDLKGPYTVGTNWMSVNNIDSSATIIKNGKSVSADSIDTNDIVYYSKDLNLVWAYANKVTGTYEKATPNQDNPTSITVAGRSYAIEGVSAFNKLSSNGSCKLGDTITVLLGRNGEIADVVTDGTDNAQYGFLTEAGTKQFTSASGNSESAYYAKIVTADGTALELRTDRNYDLLKNKVVLAKINNGKATLSSVAQNSSKISGVFNYKMLTLDNSTVSENVKILDVMAYNDVSLSPDFVTVYPQRLDGAELSRSDIICLTYDENGRIDRMFLNDVTGDGYAYGVTTDVNTTGGMTSMGSYTINICGAAMQYNGPIVLQMSVGNAVQGLVKNNSVSSLSKLRKVSKTVTRIDDRYAYTASGEKYALGDNVAVYKHPNDNSYTYNLISLEDLDMSSGTCEVYYNGNLSNGGRVRVIIWNTSK